MKATYVKQDDFTLIEGIDFITVKETCFLSDEPFDTQRLTTSGEDKKWCEEMQGIVDSPNMNRFEYEFIFKRTSKRRFEFTLTRLYWPEMDWGYDEVDEGQDAYVETKVLFKWIANEPDWVLMEAVKKHTGYYALKGSGEEPMAIITNRDAPF